MNPVPSTFTISETTDIGIMLKLYEATVWIQLERGSTPTPYVPYGCVGVEMQGKNLLDVSTLLSDTSQYTVCAQSRVIVKGLDNAVAWASKPLQYLSAGTYTIVNDGPGKMEYYTLTTNIVRIDAYAASTFTLPRDGWIRLKIGLSTTYPAEVYPYLIEGTHPYVPYLHHTIPVPLPSKGYAAALPDGTADTLTINGAGRWEWENNVHRIDSYDGETVGDTYLSTTGALTTGAEVYHPAATPSDDDFGYVDLPPIEGDATVTCPELDALGVTYLIGDEVAAMARQWHERVRSEYEGRIAALEQSVAEIIAG